MSFLELPYDIIDSIAAYLTVREYMSLSYVSQKFRQDLSGNSTARKCLETSLAISTRPERIDDDIKNGRAHRRLNNIYCQYEALRCANPYSATLLAHATSFICTDSILCYTTITPTQADIRILDLSTGNRVEKVITSQFLLQKLASTINTTSLPPSLKTITLLSITADILTLSCETNSGPYLFAINITSNRTSRIILFTPLRSINKLFVRHNAQYLYYGTHSATGSSSYREWLIQGFDLLTSQPLTPTPIQLHDFAGSDLYSVVDFTIHNNYFHAITNQTSFESEEINWTSYYVYIRFPLSSGGASKEDVQLRTIWRRQDIEGPINDAFTDLSFQVDQTTNDLVLVEIRKEWPQGGSTSHRTCYMQPFEAGLHGLWSDRGRVNPNDQLGTAVEEKDRPRYEADYPPRIDKYRHREFSDGYTGERHEYTKTKTKFSTYSYNSSSFVELVVDDITTEGSWRAKERIRLRVASRNILSPLQLEHWQERLLRPRILDKQNVPIEGSEEVYSDTKIKKWPAPEEGTLPEEIEDLLCPGGKAGDVKAVLCDQGIVYMAGATADEYGQRSLIYISFDPNFGFEGMLRVDGSLARPRKRATPEADSPSSHTGGGGGTKRMSPSSIDDPMQGYEVGQKKLQRDGDQDYSTSQGKEKEKENAATMTASSTLSSTITSSANRPPPTIPLLFQTPARYLSLQQGWWLR